MKLFRNIVVATAVISSAPAWADGSGLPQFDTTLFPEQLFWLVVTFGFLYLMMSRVALPRVQNTKDNRQHIISNELEAAEAANDSAKAAVIATEKVLTQARARANEHVTTMLAELSAEMSAQQTAQEKELKRKLNRAEVDIAVVREAALKKVQDSAAELAAAIVESMSGAKARGQV